MHRKSLGALVGGLLATSFAFAIPAIAEAKGGHGHGHGHGDGGGHHAHMHDFSSPPGWSHGRKVGWRGMGCPPGLWKQGRC
jgi:hypothetical protein